jgi:hypothetical protein
MTVIVQEGSVGVRFLIQLVDEKGANLDLTGADLITIRFSTPHVDSIEATADKVNPPGADGLVEMFTIPNQMVPFGDWDIQAFVRFTAGDNLPTKPKAFVVRENIIKPI